MRTRKENFTKGSCFHVYNHAIPELILYKDDEDYNNCLARFEIKVKQYPASVFAFCLMPNHYHFLLRQDSDKCIYRIFNDVFAGYVQYYNKKYRRRGALFQNSLQHKIIELDKYAIYLSAYIHNNPFKAGLVSNIDDWKYSNYHDLINGNNEKALVCNELLKWNDFTEDDYILVVKNLRNDD